MSIIPLWDSNSKINMIIENLHELIVSNIVTILILK